MWLDHRYSFTLVSILLRGRDLSCKHGTIGLDPMCGHLALRDQTTNVRQSGYGPGAQVTHVNTSLKAIANFTTLSILGP